MARDADDHDHDHAAVEKKMLAYGVFVRLLLPPYTIHFKSPTYMKHATLHMLDSKICKETLKSTAQDARVREVIGGDVKFWQELAGLLKAAVPSLERRSFTIWDPSSVDYESTSGALIASHYPALWKDLERLNDIVSISRNILTIGERAQDLAAESGMETEIFRLINCCVRVTARGYDGEAGTGDEEKWQWIVNAYKKVLITSLQFLNNLVAQNERRKLMLWIALFDHTSEAALAPEDIPETSARSFTDVPSNPSAKPEPPITSHDILLAYGTNGTETIPQEDIDKALPVWETDPFLPLPSEVVAGKDKLESNGYVLFCKDTRDVQFEFYHREHKRDPTIAEQFLEPPNRWAHYDVGYWQDLYEDAMAKYRQDMAVYEAKVLAALPRGLAAETEVPDVKDANQIEQRLAILEQQLADEDRAEGTDVQPLGPPTYTGDGSLTFSGKNSSPRSIGADDMKMLFTAEAGKKILESGKAELMKRLEGYEPSDPNLPPSRNADSVTTKPVKVVVNHAAESTKSMSRSPPSVNVDDPLSRREQQRGHAAGRAHVRQNANVLDEVPDGSAVDDEEERRDLDNDPDHEHDHEHDHDHDHDPDHEHDHEHNHDHDHDQDEDESEQGEEEDEEDYPGSTEDGRGLLTDVPLILGPSEIEVLPMLIMSGIVPPTTSAEDPKLSANEKNALINMHTVRTHLLLSQTSGRNLLRELLIFVAAWDLREEELYFKFMVKIMEAILKNGLMPYCYHAFRDRSRSKDIISPAQAVIMKLLTCIFRGRGGGDKPAKDAAGGTNERALTSANPTKHDMTQNPPSRVDLHILNFIFTEFRQHIIPQTCALIFLQGQIHAGKASPEDFPLNLWDMERMYEGVYQYLEFFAVCCEEGSWKGILGNWEMACELVTLLRELEGGIPKMNAGVVQMPIGRKAMVAQQGPQRSMSADAAMIGQSAVAVERPFDVDGLGPTLPPLPLHEASASTIFEPETPLTFPEDMPPLPSTSSLPTHDLAQHDQDEPSDFEWRNLKKLTVLVLSSLIWKNKLVQEQVRVYGGLEALVGCCRNDEHNPYIREHAIMCLRFAVEGNEENAKVIKSMASSAQQRLQLEGGSVMLGSRIDGENVPREVLDTQGYETFMDPKGQYGLRRKDGQPYVPAPHAHASVIHPSATTSGSSTSASKPRISAPKLTAEKAAELMQNALRDLPLGDKLVTEKQKQEALAKLDKAFESTEKALARGGVGK